jgi:hypothetical protein
MLVGVLGGCFHLPMYKFTLRLRQESNGIWDGRLMSIILFYDVSLFLNWFSTRAFNHKISFLLLIVQPLFL